MTTNYKALKADRMFMTGYSTYYEGYELQAGFSRDSLDASPWIPAGSTERNLDNRYARSSIWISLSYNRIS